MDKYKRDAAPVHKELSFKAIWAIYHILSWFLWDKEQENIIPVKLPRIFLGAPMKVNGAPGNSQGNFTGMEHFIA